MRTDGKKRKGKYRDLVSKKDKLYNVFEDNETQRKKEKECGGGGASMGKTEEVYLTDMRSDKKMECGDR